jgi:hypothetical protein
MNKQAQLRIRRKLRRNIGSQPKTRLMVVEFLEKEAIFYYRDRSVRFAEYSPVPALRFAVAEVIKGDLYDLGFTCLSGGNIFFRANISLKDMYRLFPKSRIQVLPNQQ